MSRLLVDVTATQLVHLDAELLRIPAVLPRRENHVRGQQTPLGVAGQRAPRDADHLRGLRRGQQLGHLLTVKADVTRSIPVDAAGRQFSAVPADRTGLDGSIDAERSP